MKDPQQSKARPKPIMVKVSLPLLALLIGLSGCVPPNGAGVPAVRTVCQGDCPRAQAQ